MSWGIALGALGIGSSLLGSSSADKAAKRQASAARQGIEAQREALESFEERTEPFRQLGLSTAPELLNLLGIAPPPELQAAAVDPNLAGHSREIDDINAELRRLELLGTNFGGLQNALIRRRDQMQAELDAAAAQTFAGTQPAAPSVPSVSTPDALLGEINPLVSFLRDEGFEDIQEQAAAQGRLRSGGTLEDLTEFNTQLASTVVPQLQQQRFNQLFNLLGLGQNAATGQGTAQLQTASNVSNLLGNVGAAQAGGILGRNQAIQGGISDFAGLLGAQRAATAVAPPVAPTVAPAITPGIGRGATFGGGF